MIGPLIKMEIAICKTSTEFNVLDKIEALDFTALKILLNAMESVKLAVENLSREDATLVSAAKISQFLFNKFLLNIITCNDLDGIIINDL